MIVVAITPDEVRWRMRMVAVTPLTLKDIPQAPCHLPAGLETQPQSDCARRYIALLQNAFF